jgi:hypothetical protein
VRVFKSNRHCDRRYFYLSPLSLCLLPPSMSIPTTAISAVIMATLAPGVSLLAVFAFVVLVFILPSQAAALPTSPLSTKILVAADGSAPTAPTRTTRTSPPAPSRTPGDVNTTTDRPSTQPTPFLPFLPIPSRRLLRRRILLLGVPCIREAVFARTSDPAHTWMVQV